MEPLRGKKIRGNWATLLLPIEPDESIDYQALEQEIDVLIEIEVDGIYSNGTAGEFYTQREEEFDRIHSLLATKCNRADMPFQIGATHMSAQIALDRLERAAAYEPSAIQVILPDWSPVNRDEIIRFLNDMAAAADPIGLVLYNPPYAKTELTPAEFGELSEVVTGLEGVKVSPSGRDWYREFRNNAPDLSLFIPGHELATGYMLGADGSYSNIACLSPVGAQSWFGLMESDIESALKLEQKIQTFLEDYIEPFITEQQYSNQAVDKLLAAIGDWAPIGTRLRWPYNWIPQEEVSRLRPVAKRAMPEFYKLVKRQI